MDNNTGCSIHGRTDIRTSYCPECFVLIPRVKLREVLAISTLAVKGTYGHAESNYGIADQIIKELEAK